MEFWVGGQIAEVSSLIWKAPEWRIILGMVLGVLILAASFWPRRGQPRVALEMSLWMMVVALLVFANAQPQLISDAGSQVEGKTVVLIDSSASMGIRAVKKTRSDEAEEIRQRVIETVGGDVDTFYFSGTVQRTAPETLGEQSDILNALYEVHDRYLGQQLRGVVLVTDGIDRASLQQLFLANETSSAEASAGEQKKIELPQIDGPLTIYQVGDVQEMYDASVLSVSTGGFAFQRTKFDIRAKVQGAPNEQVSVVLKKNNKPEQQQSVALDEQGLAEVSFTLRPLEVGRYAWEVSIPPAVNDVVPSNNHFPVVIKVVRDEVRILQVSGSPSYDQKFLRLFLKQDPSVDLISFFILRTLEDFASNWDSDELSLIAFPYERLFSDDLNTFDLVIFQNFNYRPYFTYQSDELLSNIAQYVRSGGAFVMTGGDRSFDLGEYNNTAVGDILPVKLGTVEQSSEIKFVPQLTTAGSVHPITQLASSPEESRRIWEQLPSMDGYNSNLGLVSGAAALLQHPNVRQGNASLPILSVREVDKGRVMALSVDSSWRWSFSKAVEGGGNQAYLRFWKNAIRWLIADPEDRQVIVSSNQENNRLGEVVTISVRTRDTAYTPVQNATVRLQVISPSGEKVRHSLITNEYGEGSIEMTPTEQGVYQLVADYGTEKAESVFAVSSRTAELFTLQPNVALMKAFSAQYEEHRYVPAGKWKEPLLNDSALRKVPKRVTISLGYAPLLFLLVALLGGAALFIRRRSGGR